MSRLLLTADFHQRCSASKVDAAIAIVADVHAPARKWAEESSFPVNDEAERCFTIGYLTGTIQGLLDALGASGRAFCRAAHPDTQARRRALADAERAVLRCVEGVSK